MLFVQEEYYSTFSSDFASVSTGVTLNVALESSYLSKVEDDYDALVDIFIKNKEEITEEKIETYIGTKVTFE